MNQQRLDELSARAQRAIKIAKDIEQLTKADPHRGGVRVSFSDFSSGTLYLDDEFLKAVIAAGRLKMLADLEGELSLLLGEEPAWQQPTNYQLREWAKHGPPPESATLQD